MTRTPIMLMASLVLSLWATPPGPAQAADFLPAQPLAMEQRQSLDIAPVKLDLAAGRAYVLGTNAAGVDVVQMYDATTLALLDTVTLAMSGNDIAIDPRGIAVYVIGNDGASSRVVVLDMDLRRIGALSIPNLLGYPVLSVTPEGLLIIGALRTGYSDGFFGVLDVKEPKTPKFRQEFRAAEAWRGVTGAWLDDRSHTLFINAAWDARVMALSAGKERVLSEFSEETARRGAREPYATFPLLGHMACRNAQGTSFLIADMSRQILSLVDYNEPFQSLDTQAIVEFSLAPTRATAERLEGTDIRQPVGVISSSCDQSVILVGSRTSFEVDQFARNRALATLEHIGTMILPFLPSDMDVSPDGRFALALSTGDRQLVRLAMPESGGPTRIIGDPGIRELQRVLTEAGLPVGSIDGIIGANTLRAVALAERRFGVELDARGDVINTIETLKEAMQ